MSKLSPKKFSFSFFLLLLSEIVYSASAYLIVVGLARFLGPADYGRYALVLGLVTMVTILVARGVPTAMAKRISENPDDAPRIVAIRKTAIHLQIPIIGGLTILFFVLSPVIARLLGDETLTPLIRLSALIIPTFALSSFYVLFLNGLQAFKAVAIIKGLRGFLRVVCVVGLGYTFALPGAIMGSALAPLLLFILGVFLSTFIEPRTKALQGVKSVSSYPVKRLLSYAGGFMLFLFLYEFYMRADLYLIKSILGDDATTGIYDAAVKIALIPYFGAYALSLMLFPTLSELSKKRDYEAIRSLLSTLGKIFGLLLPVGALVIYLFKDIAVNILFGEKFFAAGDLIPYLLGATIFGTVFYLLASVFNGSGYTKITWGIALSALFLGISLNVMYLPLYGTIATAIIFSCTSVYMGVLALFFTWRIFFLNRK